eukprot:2953916-Rhodomonas_salina.1
MEFRLRGVNVTGAVGDISITHVALGSGPGRDEWGTYKPTALADRCMYTAKPQALSPASAPHAASRRMAKTACFQSLNAHAQECTHATTPVLALPQPLSLAPNPRGCPRRIPVPVHWPRVIQTSRLAAVFLAAFAARALRHPRPPPSNFLRLP